ncbi:MAG: hypothetical protein ACQEW7_04370 [Pseudomonadota bacterium]
MKLSKTIAAAMFISALTLTLSACEQDGPMEEAGEEVDEAVEETGDAVEDATDED